METWIHTAEGVLKPDNPFETIGQEFIVEKQHTGYEGEYVGDRYVGAKAVVDEVCVRRNKNRREGTRSGRTRVAMVTLLRDDERRIRYARHMNLPKNVLKAV